VRRPVVVLIAVVVVAVLATSSRDRSERPAGFRPTPTGASVLLIVTDDQRWDTLDAMPNVGRLLAADGVTFANGFVSDPLCCPSRASILTGDLSHTTGVYRVAPPYGGFVSFDDRSTLATWLDDAGYTTGLFGKYLDAYQSAGLAGYVPPGWDRWVAPIRSRYRDLRLNVDGTTVDPPPAAYATDLLGAEAEAFIRRTDGPVFVMYTPPAPHEPAIPAARDIGSFGNLEPWDPPSFDRVSEGAPAHMAGLPPVDRAGVEALRRSQLASLQAVDRQVAALVGALADTGRLEDAVIVFTSDNGLLWGEHRWVNKEVPYEEAIRVPLVIRWPGGQAGARTDALAANIDIAPTIVDAVGLPPVSTADGVGLTGVLRAPGGRAREAIVLEHMEGTNPVPTYCGVRTEDAKLVRYATGEEELYDLATDPYELTNVAATDPRRDVLAASLEDGCRPRPPGWFEARGGTAAAAVVALALWLGWRSRRRYVVSASSSG
jgi:arylsulfatase A-like enzyme